MSTLSTPTFISRQIPFHVNKNELAGSLLVYLVERIESPSRQPDIDVKNIREA
jgi:hypothetical protein